MRQYQLILIILLQISSIATVRSQSVGLTAEDHINKLREGTLLVRLQSNQKKIDAIRSVIDTSELDPQRVEKMEKLLDQTIRETKETNTSIAKAFGSEYQFSNYAFFYDRDSEDILQGNAQPYDTSLVNTVAIDRSKPLYILVDGRTQETSRDGYILLNGDLEPLPRPFPSNYIRGGFAGIIAAFSGKGEKSHVGRINKKLFKFYDRVN